MRHPLQRQFVLALSLMTLGLMAIDRGQFVFVVLDRATVHAQPKHFSKPVGVVPEGAALKAMSAENGWVEILSPAG